MKITTRQLRQIVCLLIDHLDQQHQKEFEIDVDFYWDVPKESRYDQYAEPSDHTVGQLSDDWTNLCGMLDGSNELIGYGLVWAASILRRIGEESVG